MELSIFTLVMFFVIHEIEEDILWLEAVKDKYTNKQKRQAEHIEKSYEEKGLSDKEAERRAWATVNKETGGGEKEGGSDMTNQRKRRRRRVLR